MRVQEAGPASCGFAACDLPCGVLVNGGDGVRLSAKSRVLGTAPERLLLGSFLVPTDLGSSARPLCLGGRSLIKTQRAAGGAAGLSRPERGGMGQAIRTGDKAEESGPHLLGSDTALSSPCRSSVLVPSPWPETLSGTD